MTTMTMINAGFMLTLFGRTLARRPAGSASISLAARARRSAPTESMPAVEVPTLTDRTAPHRRPASAASGRRARRGRDRARIVTGVAQPAPRRRFLKLWAGQTISVFGSQITGFAIPIAAALILRVSPLEFGLLTAVEFLRTSSSACPPASGSIACGAVRCSSGAISPAPSCC